MNSEFPNFFKISDEKEHFCSLQPNLNLAFSISCYYIYNVTHCIYKHMTVSEVIICVSENPFVRNLIFFFTKTLLIWIQPFSLFLY